MNKTYVVIRQNWGNSETGLFRGQVYDAFSKAEAAAQSLARETPGQKYVIYESVSAVAGAVYVCTETIR